MTANKLIYAIKSDLYRKCGNTTIKDFLKCFLREKSFPFIFWYRVARNTRNIPMLGLICKLVYRRYKKVYVCDLDHRTEIGLGFSMHHVFGTAIDVRSKIGSNVTILHNVTIGNIDGKSPIIGNRVYIGPGACIIGGITVGDGSIIGANSVVTTDVPPNSVVVCNKPRMLVKTKLTPDNSTFVDRSYDGI